MDRPCNSTWFGVMNAAAEPANDVSSAFMHSVKADRDRRQFERQRLEVPLQIFDEDRRTEGRGRNQDISMGGLSFRARRPYALGERLLVRWDDVQTGATRWRRGTVVRSAVDNQLGSFEPRCLVALEFDTPSAA